MQKRGQITAFIIVAIVIAIIFFSLFAVTQRMKRAKLEARADEIQAELLETTGFNYYVTLCVRKAVGDGLELLGRQGGNIYSHQNGTADLYATPHVRYGENEISYMIVRSPLLGKEIPVPPAYPYGFFPLMTQGRARYWFYGDLKLPFACQPGGPNDINVTIVVATPCPANSLGPNSMQEQLAKFAQVELQECVNLTYVEQLTGYRLEAEEPNITITWTAEDLIVNARYPLIINISNYRAMRLFDFKTTMPVRFKRIYELVDNIMSLDWHFINYNIMDLYKESFAWDSKINVTKFCPYCKAEKYEGEHKYTDVIRIVDEQSTIEGHPWVFQFAVVNRIPALELIHEAPAVLGAKYNIIALAGDTIKIEPIGYDPDDDNLTYTYSGWKESYDEEFDWLGVCDWDLSQEESEVQDCVCTTTDDGEEICS
jgi:hypothetical protein